MAEMADMADMSWRWSFQHGRQLPTMVMASTWVSARTAEEAIVIMSNSYCACREKGSRAKSALWAVHDRVSSALYRAPDTGSRSSANIERKKREYCASSPFEMSQVMYPCFHLSL